jgi:AcrR family transcriptional regulator
MRLLVMKPIDAVAIDEIVNAAGVAKGSFYNHFNDRESLTNSILDSIRQEIEEAVHRLNNGVDDPARRVARGIAIYADYMIADPQRAKVVLRLNSGVASAQNPLNLGVLTDITQGLVSGRFIVPSADTGALFVMGTTLIALIRVVEEPDRQRAAVMTQQLSALLLRGLGLSVQESEAISGAAVHQLIIAANTKANWLPEAQRS